MEEFYEVYSKNCRDNGLKLEIYHSPVMDWVVTIYQINLSDIDNPNEIIKIQDPERKLAIAKAYVALVDWLLENQGGY